MHYDITYKRYIKLSNISIFTTEKKNQIFNRKYLKKNKLKKSKTFRYKQRQTGRMNYGVIIVADQFNFD